jgi:hypothetical protein
MTAHALTHIKELYRLWEPVYPHLAQHVKTVYGRADGTVLEIGPFCGLIFAMLRMNLGTSFGVAAFPPGLAAFFRDEAERLRVSDRVGIIESDPSLSEIEEGSIDLLLFRGALFFPRLFQVDFPAIYRVLARRGIAFVGGGFGNVTPAHIIRSVAERSKELNLRLGKVEVAIDRLRDDFDSGKIPGRSRISEEGGLWVVMRKE